MFLSTVLLSLEIGNVDSCNESSSCIHILLIRKLVIFVLLWSQLNCLMWHPGSQGHIHALISLHKNFVILSMVSSIFGLMIETLELLRLINAVIVITLLYINIHIILILILISHTASRVLLFLRWSTRELIFIYFFCTSCWVFFFQLWGLSDKFEKVIVWFLHWNWRCTKSNW